MQNTKIKLTEISYNFEPANTIDDLFKKRFAGTILRNYLSKYFDITCFNFSNFILNAPINGINYSIKNEKIGKITIPFAFHKTVKKENPQVVLIHGINNFFQIIHLKIGLGKKVKLIVQHHAEQPTGFFKKTLLKISSYFVDVYLFTSIQTAIKLGLAPNKVVELMEGSSEIVKINKLEARQLLNIPLNETIYLWVGRLIDVKNPLFFLNTFNSFSENLNKLKLYLIYNDDALLNECKAICQQNSNIIFVGSVNHSEMKNWYSAADFFVSASVYEGSGYALCEAMSCNLIPIISNINSFNFMTDNGNCALTFESNDSLNLLEALNASLSINKKEMEDKIEQQFKTKLSYNAITENFYELVKCLQ